MIRLPPYRTRFPYTTLFRSRERELGEERLAHEPVVAVGVIGVDGTLVAPEQVDRRPRHLRAVRRVARAAEQLVQASRRAPSRDRKSTRLNSSHGYISYAVFC